MTFHPSWYLRLIASALALAGCGCTGMRPVNPGAQCEIVPGLTDNGMAIVAEHCGEHCNGGAPRGLWVPLSDGRERIYLRGMVGEGGFTLVHEVEHHLEAALVKAHDFQGLRVARHAFRELMGGGFEIGQEDLMGELP